MRALGVAISPVLTSLLRLMPAILPAISASVALKKAICTTWPSTAKAEPMIFFPMYRKSLPIPTEAKDLLFIPRKRRSPKRHIQYGRKNVVRSMSIFFRDLEKIGIGLFALPAGILSAGFVEELRSRKDHSKKCPHCGAKLDS